MFTFLVYTKNKTELHNKYMVQLCVWLIFWTHLFQEFTRKDDLNVPVFPYKNWGSPKSDRWFFFFQTLTDKGPFHRKDFKWEKYGVTGLISEKKTKVLRTELNERAEAATGSYSVTVDSLQYIYSVPVTKNHRNTRSRCLFHEFYFADIL